MHVDQLANNGQAEPETAGSPSAGIRLAEALEHVRQELG